LLEVFGDKDPRWMIITPARGGDTELGLFSALAIYFEGLERNAGLKKPITEEPRKPKLVLITADPL
jgi:hypothetical protein